MDLNPLINKILIRKKAHEDELNYITDNLNIDIRKGIYPEDFQKTSHQLFGKNKYRRIRQTPFYKILLDCIMDFSIFLILICGLTLLSINLVEKYILQTKSASFLDSSFIFFTIVLNIMMSSSVQYFQESFFFNFIKRENFRRVSHLVDGKIQKKNIKKVIVGDILYLKQGEKVPADGILLRNNSIYVDQSTITGESESIQKNYLDVIFGETYITEGNAYVLILAVGRNSISGKILREINLNKKTRSSLKVQSEFFILNINSIAIIIGIFLFLSGFFFIKETLSMRLVVENLLISISMAIMIIPEGLPISLNLTTMINIGKLRKEGIYLKNKNIIEEFKNTKVICFDKTGTLTKNQFFVKSLFTGNKTYARNIKSTLRKDKLFTLNILLNNKMRKENKIEQCLNQLCKKDCKVPAKVLKGQYYTSRMKYSYVIVKYKGEYILLIKGAPDILIEKLPAEINEFIAEESKVFSKTILFAYKKITDLKNYDLSNLKISGLIALSDELRKDTFETVQILNANHKLLIITGDSREVTEEIALALNIITERGNESIDADDFFKLDYFERIQILKKLKIISRCTPDQKKKIVELLQYMKMKVCFIGDGTNDSTAISAADFGLTLRNIATDITKTSADVIFFDENINKITHLIKSSHNLNLTVRKFVRFQLTISIVLVLSAMSSLFIFHKNIFNPKALLWFNIYIDFLVPICFSLSNYKFRNEEEEEFVSKKILRHLFINGIFISLYFFFLKFLDISNITIFIAFLLLIFKLQFINMRYDHIQNLIPIAINLLFYGITWYLIYINFLFTENIDWNELSGILLMNFIPVIFYYLSERIFLM